MELVKQLAKIFGVSETEAEVLASANDSAKLRAEMKRTLSAERGSTTELLDAVNGAVKKLGQLGDRFVALTKAIGVKEGEDPVSRVTDLLKAEKDLGELKEQHVELTKKVEAQEEKEIDSDVNRAIHLHSLPDSVKDALVLFRRTKPKEFAKKYPLPPPEQDHLTQVITTSTRAAAVQEQRQAASGNVIDLSAYPGRNDAERAANHILATNPTAKNWSRERLFDEVHRLRQAQGGR